MKDQNSKSLDEKTCLDREHGRYELPEIVGDIICPVCGKKELEMHRTMYCLPDKDEVLILLLVCKACSYKKTDMIPMYTAFQPGEYQLTVDDTDLTHKIFRGATGDLEIPEIGITIERGPASSFQFTNIEGILMNIQEHLEFFLNTTPIDTLEWMNANESKKRLLNILSGKMAFKVILRDYEGGSYISANSPEKLTFIPHKEKIV